MSITHMARVMVPVWDQDKAIEFYTKALGFTVLADAPYGDGERWVEVAPPGGGTAIGLTPPRGEGFQPGRRTAMAWQSSDLEADHSALKDLQVDVDDAILGGQAPSPRFFFVRDPDGNQMMVVER